MKKGKVRKARGLNRFHIYPKRRFPRLRSSSDNVTMVDIQKHADYHQLFGLKTPEEIIHYLNSYFWGNRFALTIERRKENGKEDNL